MEREIDSRRLCLDWKEGRDSRACKASVHSGRKSNNDENEIVPRSRNCEYFSMIRLQALAGDMPALYRSVARCVLNQPCRNSINMFSPRDEANWEQ